MAFTEIVEVKLVFPGFPPPVHDHQCPGDLPVSLVGQNRMTTPVPTFVLCEFLVLTHNLGKEFGRPSKTRGSVRTSGR